MHGSDMCQYIHSLTHGWKNGRQKSRRENRAMMMTLRYQRKVHLRVQMYFTFVCSLVIQNENKQNANKLNTRNFNLYSSPLCYFALLTTHCTEGQHNSSLMNWDGYEVTMVYLRLGKTTRNSAMRVNKLPDSNQC